ncbi:hypothetical protein V6N11_030754 [Hibiscus sabdariffa]|uniref:Secreted protein n=1 Tax=Hibiscus sabdariffa TaxID=183260 RepID=A0ABR2NBM9_9ROSI
MVAVGEVLPVVAAATPLDGGVSNLSFNRRLLQIPANPWTRDCSRIFSMVAVVEVLPVVAAATSLDGGASDLSFNRLLRVPANPWTRGCSKIFRCRGGGPGVRG